MIEGNAEGAEIERIIQYIMEEYTGMLFLCSMMYIETVTLDKLMNWWIVF